MIQLNLTLEQVNIILAALSELPFKMSNGVINEIHKQAQPQLQTAQTEPQMQIVK